MRTKINHLHCSILYTSKVCKLDPIDMWDRVMVINQDIVKYLQKLLTLTLGVGLNLTWCFSCRCCPSFSRINPSLQLYSSKTNFVNCHIHESGSYFWSLILYLNVICFHCTNMANFENTNGKIKDEKDFKRNYSKCTKLYRNME